VRIGTVDSYIAAVLSKSKLHVTDSSNAAVTGLCNIDALSWSPRLCELLKVEIGTLPKIVASSGVIGNATALPGAPPIAALIGDQQSSLVGQACITSGATKITFGTGGMLNTFTGQDAPTKFVRSEHGVYPIVAFRDSVATYWASEAIMLSAGTNLDWLCQDLQLISSPSESHELASQVPDSGGVVFVPALFGLGTPHWDYGARGTLLGITRGTNRAHIVRSVLEGIAHRGADMVDSVVGETKLDIKSIRIDGGMSRNPSFVQALANATGRKIEVSPITEATTLGAAFLAGAEVSFWHSLEQATTTWKPAQIIEPTELLNRAQWHEAVSRARNWIPALSSLDF
jgi:glycerol kinase